MLRYSDPGSTQQDMPILHRSQEAGLDSTLMYANVNATRRRDELCLQTCWSLWVNSAIRDTSPGRSMRIRLLDIPTLVVGDAETAVDFGSFSTFRQEPGNKLRLYEVCDNM